MVFSIVKVDRNIHGCRQSLLIQVDIFLCCVRCENHLLWMMVFVVLHLIADKNLLLVVVESHSWKVSSV